MCNISAYILVNCNITNQYATTIFINNNNNIINDSNGIFKKNYQINFKHLNMLINIENWDDLLNDTDINNSLSKFNVNISEFINLSSNS